MNKQVLIGLSTLSLVTILSGVALSSSNSSAASASTATAAVKIAASCTLTSTGGGNYSATVPNGTSAEIPGSTLSVSCNDAGGFALYAVGYSNDTIGNNNMIGSSVNIATNTSGNDSYWAMKINPTTGNTPTIDNSFDSFHIVPNAHTKVASYSGSTGTGSLSVDATYKANISSTQLAGNYLGKVKYTLLHPVNAEEGQQEITCEASKICYSANTVKATGDMGKQALRRIQGAGTGGTITNNSTAMLTPSNFKREGYGFAGWNTSFDYYGTNYGPEQTIITPPDIETNGLSLYAIWIESAGTIQNWDGCSALSQGSTTALTDERDGNTYAVAKLADGKCWMIENLRLADKDADNNDINLSSSNTHNPSLPLNNAWYYNALQTTLTTSNHLTVTDPLQVDWCNNNNSSSCINQSMLATNNTTLFTDNTGQGFTSQGNIYSYGNYYNWYSATAGHGVYSKSSGDVTGDICPTGWHLPTGGSENAEFGVLDKMLGGTGKKSSTYTTPAGEIVSNSWRLYPNNFIRSGEVNPYIDPSIYLRSKDGYYWASSAYDSNSAYVLSISNVRLDPVDTFGKYNGMTVRCIVNT